MLRIITFVLLLLNFPLFAQIPFEKAKLEILCQAVRFNHIQQGKIDIARKIDCSTLQTLEKTIPNSSRASKNIISAYKNKVYSNLISDEEKIRQFKKDIWKELRSLAPRISKSADFQVKWKTGLDSLSTSLDKTLGIATTDEGVQMNDSKGNTNTGEVEEMIIPAENQKLPPPETSSNTGLWIIAILSILIAFVSVGYAYLVAKTTSHRIKEMENMFKERYQHLDTRMDKMLTREEFKKLTNTH